MFNLESKKWKPGNPIYINKLQWGKKEIEKIYEVLESDWMGGNSVFNLNLEKMLSEFSGLKYFQTVVSGSAGVELAVQALLQSGKIKKGDVVLHPTLTFPTSISSAIRAGLIPLFVDINPETYLIDLNLVENLVENGSRVNLIILPAILGNIPDVIRIRKLLPNVPLILDCCDTMGGKLDGKELACYGDISVYSMYGSHHISAFGGGGAVGTNDPFLYDIIKSLTFWGRKFEEYTNKVDSFKNRYTYKTLGYNLQLSAVQAAFAIAQMERLQQIIETREKMFSLLQRFFSRYNKWFVLPRRDNDRAEPSWFGYPLTVKPSAPFDRDEFIFELVERNIEIRPIFCEFFEQPIIHGFNYRFWGDSRNSNNVSRNGLFIPLAVYEEPARKYYFDVLSSVLKNFEKR